MQVFEKYNTSKYRDALIKEAQGLSLLHAACEDETINIRVPEIIAVNEQKLELVAINSIAPKASLMRSLGEGLARVHQLKNPMFGLQYDNYIGLNPQINKQEPLWGYFFLNHRLKVQISWIKQSEVRAEFLHWVSEVESALEAYLNQNNDGPSLLHGDLWSGNAMFDESSAWLIDPAVYFGDREVDIAMTEMFGGFSEEFYDGYNQVWPISDSYQLKKSIYNLYHFLNHYNLFGSSYLPACRRLAKEIASKL